MQADTHLLRSTKHINNPKFLKKRRKVEKKATTKEITKYVDYWTAAAEAKK